mgnify:FL=1
MSDEKIDVANPEEISGKEMIEIEKKATTIDMTGEVCPYPQIKAREHIQELQSGGILIVKTDHVIAVQAVPQSIRDNISRLGLWKSSDGEYKIVMWKK